MSCRPTIAAVQRAVADRTKVPLRIMASRHQDRSTTRVRQIAMALAYELTGHSGPVVARYFGDRDPTTVVYARHQVALRRAADPELDAMLRRLERQLRTGLDPQPPSELQLAFLDGPLFDLGGAEAARA